MTTTSKPKFHCIFDDQIEVSFKMAFTSRSPPENYILYTTRSLGKLRSLHHAVLRKRFLTTLRSASQGPFSASV